MSNFGEVNVKNAADAVINPATEEKQDDVITAVGLTATKAIQTDGTQKTQVTGLSETTSTAMALNFTESGRARVANLPYEISIAQGDIPNHTALFKFGTRTSVAANTQSSVWEGPTALYAYLPSAQQLKVSSSSGLDVAAGTGARTMTLIGLDSSYNELEETITLTGTAVATTTGSFIRIHRGYVATSGTGYTNAGIITVTNNAGTVTQMVIPAGDAQTLMAMWTVPLGKTLYITAGSASTDTSKGARVSLFTRQLDGGILHPWRIRYRAYLFGGNENFPFNIPLEIPAKTDVQVRVLTPAAAGTTSFGATFEGWYEDV